MLFNGSKSVRTMAYFDEGSELTLIDEDLVRALRASGMSQPLKLRWTGNIVREERHSECVSLKISGMESFQRFDLKNAHTVERLYLPKQHINFGEIVRQYRHLKGVEIPDQIGDQPKILIGLNNAYLLAPLDSRIGNADEPIGVKSHLGWTVFGPTRSPPPMKSFVGHHVGLTNAELHYAMRKYFTVEDMEGTVSLLPESTTDRRAREIMQNTTVKRNGRYETGLLWKTDGKVPTACRWPCIGFVVWSVAWRRTQIWTRRFDSKSRNTKLRITSIKPQRKNSKMQTKRGSGTFPLMWF